MRKFISALLLVGALAFVGCEKSDGEKVDDAVKDGKEAVDGAVKDLKDAAK